MPARRIASACSGLGGAEADVFSLSMPHSDGPAPSGAQKSAAHPEHHAGPLRRGATPRPIGGIVPRRTRSVMYYLYLVSARRHRAGLHSGAVFAVVSLREDLFEALYRTALTNHVLLHCERYLQEIRDEHGTARRKART